VSTLVLCDPAKPERKCTIIARNLSGGTGVIVRQGRVIAASFLGSYLFDVDRSKIDGQIFLRRFARVPYPEHMTIADDQTVLIASQIMPAFALHAKVKASAPTAIYRLNPEADSSAPAPLFQDDGQVIKAASSAVWYGKKLFLGRTYEDGVLAVPIPDGPLDSVLRCEVGRPAPEPRNMVDSGEADRLRKSRAIP
jgi:hypothetical protein